MIPDDYVVASTLFDEHTGTPVVSHAIVSYHYVLAQTVQVNAISGVVVQVAVRNEDLMARPHGPDPAV